MCKMCLQTCVMARITSFNLLCCWEESSNSLVSCNTGQLDQSYSSPVWSTDMASLEQKHIIKGILQFSPWTSMEKSFSLSNVNSWQTSSYNHAFNSFMMMINSCKQSSWHVYVVRRVNVLVIDFDLKAEVSCDSSLLALTNNKNARHSRSSRRVDYSPEWGNSQILLKLPSRWQQPAAA